MIVKLESKKVANVQKKSCRQHEGSSGRGQIASRVIKFPNLI